MMVSLAHLTTMSDYGLVFIRVLFQMREYIDQANGANVKDRKKAADLLEKMAECLGRIEVEVRADRQDLGRDIGAMREYLAAFPSIFTPLLGETKTKEVQANMCSLFVRGDSEFGPMGGGFLELKKYTEEGLVTEAHANASIATITLVQGQLGALADLISFPESFAETDSNNTGDDPDV